jgi:transposase InsO family protein
VADITYIRMREEFAYLAVVLDAFSRRAIGWALDAHVQASLAIAALKMAIGARRPAAGSLIHHSDRGVQYACNDYTVDPRGLRHPAQHEPRRLSIRQRQGGKLHEDAQTRRSRWPGLSRCTQARSAICDFLEQVYNRQRLHSALAYRPPAEFEASLPPRRATQLLSVVPATRP